MSKLIADTFRHTGGSADNITLDGSQNVTIEGNLTVDGTLSGVSLGAALTGSTNNTVCTVTGANAIQGEANLTFDGSTLQIPDDVKFKFGTGGDLEIFHDPDGGDSSAAINKIMANNGDLRIGTQLNKRVILGAYYDAAGGGDTMEVWGGSNILPATNDAIDCGETNHKWDDIYATNSTIQTSDRNTKDNITTSDLGLSFVNKLSPKSYKFKGKTRTHYGLIAQDIETVLGDISKPTSGFAGFIKTDSSENKDGSSYNYGLRYGEFIGPLIKAVQELSAEVETLKTKVATLEAG